jgi:hypothetical protein
MNTTFSVVSVHYTLVATVFTIESHQMSLDPCKAELTKEVVELVHFDVASSQLPIIHKITLFGRNNPCPTPSEGSTQQCTALKAESTRG